MPIYEYRCGACGHQLEVMQKMNAPLLSECPQCYEEKLTKLMSAGGFRMKSSRATPVCSSTGAAAMPSCGGCPALE